MKNSDSFTNWLKSLLKVPMNTWQFEKFSKLFLEKWNKTHDKIITASVYGSNSKAPLNRDEINALLETEGIEYFIVESSICDQTIFMIMEGLQEPENVISVHTELINTFRTVETSNAMIVGIIQDLLEIKAEGRKIIGYSLDVDHIPINEAEAPVTIEMEIPPRKD